MPDVKWIKINTSMFDDEKIKLIETMPDKDSILIIWIKLLIQAGKTNASGYIFLNEKIPYTEEMLAAIFNRPVNTIRMALETFQRFGMIEIEEDGKIFISNWEKHQNVEGMEKIREQTRARVARHREKKKQIPETCNVTRNVTVTLRNAPDIDIDKDIDKDKDNTLSVSNDTLCRTNVQPIIDAWNSLGLTQIRSINPTTNRHKLLKARIKEYGFDSVMEAIDNVKQSSFLRGQNNRGWVINFDWFLRPNNFVKVLEGNYNDKPKVTENDRNKKPEPSVNKQPSRILQRIRDSLNRGDELA